MGLFKKNTEGRDSRTLLLLRGKRGLVTGTAGLENSAFWSCIMQLARLYATLPWDGYAKDVKGNRKEASLLLQNLLAKPNKWMTSYEFRFVMALNFELHGEAYAIINRTDRGLISYLTPIPTGAVVSLIDDSGNIVYQYDGKRYAQEDMLVIKNTPSGFTTVLSPASHAHNDLDLEQKCKEMQMDYFDGASIIGNLIKVPSNLTQEQKDQIKAGFDTTKGFRNMVVDNRIDVTPIQVNSADISKLVEAQRWTAKQVAARFGVPSFFVGITDGAYNNLEDQNIYFMTYCLNPRLRAWEEALKDALCLGSEYIEFNREGLLQGNSAAKISYYNAGLMNGWISRNEIRAKENLPSLGKDGDVFFMQTNMGTVDNIIAGNYGNQGSAAWGTEEKEPKTEPVVEKQEPILDKKAQERLYIEEVNKQALSSRKKLESLLRGQLKDELADFKANLESGDGYDLALEKFGDILDACGKKYRKDYFDLYKNVANKLKPIIQKQIKTNAEVDEESTDEFVNQYVDGLLGRHGGFIYKRVKKAGDPESFEAEAEDLKANYPINESNEEVHRSANALSLFMYSCLGVTVYHIVADADACAFCQTLDGKVASINGYVLQKGAGMPDGDGGTRKIDKNYRHPPFHTNCHCSIVAGE